MELERIFTDQQTGKNFNRPRYQVLKEDPFKVVDDDKMQELVESIRDNGILTPVLVRPKGKGYEMLSGHRRMHAAKLAGVTAIPAIIRELDDDDATIVMVEANAQEKKCFQAKRRFHTA